MLLLNNPITIPYKQRKTNHCIENVNSNKDINVEDQDIPKIQQKIDVKKLDLEDMFASNENGK